MSSCGYCNSTIILGGVKHAGAVFCNQECLQKNALSSVASQVPEQTIRSYVARIHRGNCGLCGGHGPVDVHTSYRIYSALFFSSWSSRPAICCQRCGNKRKIGDTVFSLFLGWWGIPWGLLMTPVQSIRNMIGLFRESNALEPSPELEKMVRLHIASDMIERQQLNH